ncbi:hypothetical protein ASZ78_011167 [Callipepla squamata]|uniref:Uncharacterized protein n=1 Tax=Callipepla squamata TaxID=9009 RepID=A0A226N0K3_CALSU|nr:hypothetical protein ASZ78_011167 [Callipepla squamata]
MREAELRRLLAANLLSAVSIVLTALVPPLFLSGFSVLDTHLAWLCVCSVCVSVLSVTLCLILKPSQTSKRGSLSSKVGDRDISVCSSPVYLHYFAMFMFAGTKCTSLDTGI